MAALREKRAARAARVATSIKLADIAGFDSTEAALKQTKGSTQMDLRRNLSATPASIQKRNPLVFLTVPGRIAKSAKRPPEDKGVAESIGRKKAKLGTEGPGTPRPGEPDEKSAPDNPMTENKDAAKADLDSGSKEGATCETDTAAVSAHANVLCPLPLAYAFIVPLS